MIFSLLFALPAQDREEDNGNQALQEQIDALEKELKDLKAEVAGKQPKIRAQVGGNVEMIWQYNLRTGRSGFENLYTTDVEVVIVPEETTSESVGNGTPYGYIKLEDYALSLTPDSIDGSFGTFDSRIYWDIFWIRLFYLPDFLLNLATAIDTFGPDVRTDGNNVPVQGGLAFGANGELFDLELKVASPETQELNYTNQYGIGVDGKLKLADGRIVLVGGLSFAMDLGNNKENIDFKTKDLGLSLGTTFDLVDLWKGMEFTVAGDLLNRFDERYSEYEGFDFDLMARGAVNLSDKAVIDDADAWSHFAVAAYFNPSGDDKKLDLTASLVELEGNYGLIPVLGFSLGGSLYNLIEGDPGWGISGDLNATFNWLKAYAGMTYGDSDILTLDAGVTVTVIDKVEFDVNYSSFNLNNSSTTNGVIPDKGMISLSAKIEF